MPITIKDIAKIAGVSHSTVSRCLNNKGGYSDETFLRIQKIAYELGFVFNAGARSLSTEKTGTIGIIYDEYNYATTLHPFTVKFLTYIRKILEREDLDSIVTFSQNAINGSDNIERLINKRKVDGLIIVKSNISHSTFDFLKKRKIPFVFAHQMLDESFEEVDCVYCDHYLGGNLAGNHLWEKGCTKVMCISRNEKRSEFTLRTEGFLSAAADRNILAADDFLISGGSSFQSCYKAARENLTKIKKCNGIFVHTDIMAVGLLKVLGEEKISVPEDIAVIGYDGIEFCDFITPSLSTIEQPVEKISILTCERLVDLISGAKKMSPKRKIIPPVVIERDSTSLYR